MSLNSCAGLGRLLAELLQKGTLTIFGEGLEREFYLHIDDAVRGMVKAIFTPETAGKIFSLAPSEGITTLELTYLLKSLTRSENGRPSRNQSRQNRDSKRVGLETSDSLGKRIKGDPKVVWCQNRE